MVWSVVCGSLIGRNHVVCKDIGACVVINSGSQRYLCLGVKLLRKANEAKMKVENC